MLIDERKHPQKLQWDDQGANTMTDKITIERETLERAIADYDSAAGNDGTLLSWNRARDNLLALLRAALAAQPAEPVALGDALRWSKATESHGAYVFTPAQLRVFYEYATRAAPPAPAAVPLTDEQIDHTLATTLDEFVRPTRGMFHALDVNADITVNSRLRRMFARAVLAAAGDKP